MRKTGIGGKTVRDTGNVASVDGEDALKINERQFSQQVEDLLNLFGWQWCHFRPARTAHGWRTAISGTPGFPDYIAVKVPQVIIFELKTDKGQLSEHQVEWIKALRECGGNVECYVVRPSTIERFAKILHQGKEE